MDEAGVESLFGLGSFRAVADRPCFANAVPMDAGRGQARWIDGNNLFGKGCEANLPGLIAHVSRLIVAGSASRQFNTAARAYGRQRLAPRAFVFATVAVVRATVVAQNIRADATPRA
tara:strand:- start:15446 stop:15796 length:351 start_codon:yes stop_codon:yes gene_type:complete